MILNNTVKMVYIRHLTMAKKQKLATATRMTKKQLKITKLFRREAVTESAPQDTRFEELQKEIHELEKKLREKQNELFQIQRYTFKRKCHPVKMTTETFMRPQKIILKNSVESLERCLELMAMLTSTEVRSYMANDHCCIMFHMQYDSPYELKHGLRIDMKDGVNEIAASSLPVGFNLKAVMEDFDNVLKPECLGAIRKALLAYYDRWDQYQQLKKLVHLEAQLFKTLDGSHMEIMLCVQKENEPEEDQFVVTLILDYRVYDIMPKTYTVKELGLPENAAEVLKYQCAVFKKLPLARAFYEAFMEGSGQYKLIQQITPVSEPSRPKKRFRPNKATYNDDTFHPDDCSDEGEEDE